MTHKNKIPVAIAEGDGVGPEIMKATLQILKEAGAPLELHPVKIGEEVYLGGHPTGIETSTWEILKNTEAFLKGPITTPQGGGFKSLNVTIRGAFGLFANVRPCVSFFPFVQNKYPDMNVVVIRENEEDLYTGIEYFQTPDLSHAIKMISRSGSRRIIRYAFEYAKTHGRKKVTCFTKDNILKLTDGLFHKIFEEIAREYPEIEKEHWIIDIGAAKLADAPQQFDVVVMPNLYGDILSDVSAQIAGSIGLAGSANIGEKRSMFEAVHGSAPRRAGQDLANPSGLLQASIMMLHHLGEGKTALLIENAWLRTIEEGIHTYDIFNEKVSLKKVGTKEFGHAVVERLGKKPERLKASTGSIIKKEKPSHEQPPLSSSQKVLQGIDIYFAWNQKDFSSFAKQLESLSKPSFSLKLISSRGTLLWPETFSETHLIDQVRCRFLKEGKAISHRDLVDLLGRFAEKHFDFLHTENLYSFDGVVGY